MSEQPITSVEDAVRLLGALPMPVGPGPLKPVPVALTDEQVDALAAAGNRVVNDEMHQRLCMCDAWPKECVSTGSYFMGAWDVSGLEAALPAVLGLWEQMRGSEVERLRARVAELEAAAYGDAEVRLLSPVEQIRHLHACVAAQLSRADTLNRLCREQRARADEAAARVAELEGLYGEAAAYAAGLEVQLAGVEKTPFSLDADTSAAYPLAFPWAALMDEEDLRDFLADLAAAAITYYHHRPDEQNNETLAAVEKAVATWRLIAEAQHAHNTAPGPDAEVSADKLTRLLAPTQALREDPHDGPLRHDYRVGRDLPETGGTPC